MPAEAETPSKRASSSVSGSTPASVRCCSISTSGSTIRALHAKQAANRDAALLYGRGATIQAMLTVPMLLGLWAQGARRLALMQLALGALAIFVTDSLSAKMALATALVVAGAFNIAAAMFAVPRLRFVILGVLVLGVLALPFVLPYRPDPATACRLANNKASALHRLYIWDFAAERIAERPILGWGLDGSRRLPGGDAPVIIRRCDAALQPVGNVRVDGTVMPLHPHNAILQVWPACRWLWSASASGRSGSCRRCS